MRGKQEGIVKKREERLGKRVNRYMIEGDRKKTVRNEKGKGEV